MMTWVCEMVAKAEGEEVARKIEHEFLIWRGKHIAYAKKTGDGLGGYGEVHVNTLKRLGLL
jgi:hypothetical protein